MKNCLLLFLLAGVVLSGQEKTLTPGEVQAAYNALQYDRVIQMVKSELETNANQRPEHLTLYLKYLSLALYATEGEEAARGALSSLLLVNPDFQFSPGEASPKIRSLLETMRDTNANDSTASPPLYITVHDRRDEDILASVFKPGQGLINRGLKRGYVYRTVFTVSFLGAVTFAVTTAGAHDDYLQTTVPEDIGAAYDRYNFHYKTRNNLAVLAITTYLANIVDTYRSTR